MNAVRSGERDPMVAAWLCSGLPLAGAVVAKSGGLPSSSLAFASFTLWLLAVPLLLGAARRWRAAR